MTDHPITYFLGANSARGFVSLYERWIDQERAQSFTVIKGGAGCGKSTLMAGVARALEAAGYRAEYIRCSGDPDSLDGVSFPQKGAALMDGTSPHRLDPAYPGATGHYADLGAGYDRAALFPLRGEIVRLTKDYQSCYPQAYRRFRAAEESLKRGRTPFRTQGAAERAGELAEKLAEKEGGAAGSAPGKRSLRFLGGLTCRGRLLLETTAAALCPRRYVLRDSCGLGDLLLERLEAGFLARGCDVVACPDPLAPKRLAHLLVPERGVAFLTGAEERGQVLDTETLADPEILRERRGFLELSLRVAGELMEEGMKLLALAKEKHDALEALYHPHVDFSLCQEMTERLSGEILALPDVTD